MDKFNQLGKYLYNNRRDSDYATKRLGSRPPRVERVSDVFDDNVSFTMEFRTEINDASVTVDLTFRGPPPTACCGGCYCAVCELFSNETVLDLVYGYIAGTVNVTVDGEISTSFTETDPDGGIVTLGVTGANVRICYYYRLGECVD